MARFTCDDCKQQKLGTPTTSVTGRTLCADCADTITGLAVGMIASGGSGKLATPAVTGQAIATAGWFSFLRRKRRKRRKDQGASAHRPPPNSRRAGTAPADDTE